MHTFDLGRNVRNWFLIHRVSESFALSLTKSTMRYALSLQLPIFQGQGCDRGQHWIIRDHKMLWSTELIISFPNPLPFTLLFVTSAFSVELLFFPGNYLPFKTQPKYNFWCKAFPDFLHVTCYGWSPYLSLVPCLHKHLLKTSFPHDPTPAQTLSSWDTLLSDAASLLKFKYIPVDTKC